jgi:hypothetical protein
MSIEVPSRHTAEERTLDDSVGIDHHVSDDDVPGIEGLIDADN